MVRQEFNMARATYNAAAKHALEGLAEAFSKQRDKVRSGEFSIEPPSKKPPTILPTPNGIDSPFIIYHYHTVIYMYVILVLNQILHWQRLVLKERKKTKSD